MLWEHRPSGSLLEVLTLEDLYNPCRPHITGQLQMGEQMQDPEIFQKSYPVAFIRSTFISGASPRPRVSVSVPTTIFERNSVSELIFPSGEPSPRCWWDAHDREQISEKRRVSTISIG